jgi:hypothetical protein
MLTLMPRESRTRGILHFEKRSGDGWFSKNSKNTMDAILQFVKHVTKHLRVLYARYILESYETMKNI